MFFIIYISFEKSCYIGTLSKNTASILDFGRNFRRKKLVHWCYKVGTGWYAARRISCRESCRRFRCRFRRSFCSIGCTSGFCFTYCTRFRLLLLLCCVWFYSHPQTHVSTSAADMDTCMLSRYRL